jgi:hypothetical protein
MARFESGPLRLKEIKGVDQIIPEGTWSLPGEQGSQGDEEVD